MFAKNATFALPATPDVTATLINAVFVKFSDTACSVETLLPETLTVFAALLACANPATAASYALFTALGVAASTVLVLLTEVDKFCVVIIVWYDRLAFAVACQTPEVDKNRISAFPSPALRERSVALPSVIVDERRTIRSESFRMAP